VDKAIELDPQYGSTYYLRGLIYDGLGMPLEANRDYQTAAELGFVP
jgi:Tfp pilus assembly protein PilF